MDTILGIILGLFVLVILVVLHELGHAIVARRNGVVVEEFGVGFPPRAWKKKLKNGTLFTLNWLPLGGFVKLKGEHDSARGEGTYGVASFWVKTKILLAGVTINWLTAAVLFTILAVIGMPKILPDQVVFSNTIQTVSQPAAAQVTAGSPAEKAGLKAGDELVRIGAVDIDTTKTLLETTKKYAGQSTEVVYKRDGATHTASVQMNTAEQAKTGGYLGLVPVQTETLRSPVMSAPALGVVTTAQLSWETLKGIGSLLLKTVNGFLGPLFGSPTSKQDLAEVGGSVAGPVGILGVLFPSVLHAGLTHILLLTAIISLTLAVMNILPIPALDGGRWFVMALFRLMRKKLTKEREESIQATGFLILMILTILVTVSDVYKFF